jgi:hypothetical protein
MTGDAGAASATSPRMRAESRQQGPLRGEPDVKPDALRPCRASGAYSSKRVAGSQSQSSVLWLRPAGAASAPSRRRQHVMPPRSISVAPGGHRKRSSDVTQAGLDAGQLKSNQGRTDSVARFPRVAIRWSLRQPSGSSLLVSRGVLGFSIEATSNRTPLFAHRHRSASSLDPWSRIPS